MKKILFIVGLLITTVVFPQRGIPKGGTAGQVMKIASDGVNIAWSNLSGVATAVAPLVLTANTLSITANTFVLNNGNPVAVNLNGQSLSNVSTFTVTGSALIDGLTIGRGNRDTASNTAIGESVLNVNTTGGYNTGIGIKALKSNTTGFFNTAVGGEALRSNTTGNYNSSLGVDALFVNTTGVKNTSAGAVSLYRNTTGVNNTSIGYGALYSNVSGGGNVSVGYLTGYKSVGSNNIFIGNEAGYSETGSNKLYIGSNDTLGATIYADLASKTVGINTTTLDTCAILTLQSTTKGFLLPRMTATQGSAISSPLDGLVIYVTDTNGTFTSIGFWGRVSSAWAKLNN